MSKVQIGGAILYLGDCLTILPEISVEAVITDPPFPDLAGGIDFKSSSGVGKDSGATVGDPWEANLDWLPLAWGASTTALLTFCTYHSVGAIDRIITDLGGKKAGLVLWNKPNAPHPARNSPRHSGEFVWLFRKGPGLNWRAIDASVKNINTLTTGCMASPERLLLPGTMKAAHPTQKPIAIMDWLMGIKPKSVCDPFMGTGTTGISALRAGASFVGIEKDERFFDMACKRIEEAQRQGKCFNLGSSKN